MSVISLRLNENEEKLLNEVAKFEGIGLSTYLKKIIFERLEDEYDLKIAEDAYEKFINSGKETRSLKEVAEKAGIEL